MWTLKTFSRTFHLTEKQKDVYLNAIKNGVEFVDFGEFIVGKNMEYLISDERVKLEKLRDNPILNDPDFKKMIEGDYNAKSAAALALDTRYPGYKFKAEWDEAMANKDYLKGLVKV